MKRPKSIALLLLTGFLAFAPPGTLVFIFIFVAGLFGLKLDRAYWVAAAAIFAVLGLVAALLFIRKRKRRNRSHQ